jgi:DNA-binding CsgD family transcriptional regulator/tetratricopeptide (TPR) repeat protein
VPYAIAAALHRRTGGNPFFLEELIVAAGDAPVDRLADLPLPVNLTEAVLRHLDELDAEQRRVVDAAAILGQRIPFDLLASVTGVGEEGLIDILRELVGKGLIVEDDADVFSFRHALTREAIAGRLLARERRRLHEKSLTALQESGSDDWAALAHHAGGADRWAEMIAAARRGAALYMRTGATYQALRLVELALEEADADVELLELATRAAWSVGLPSTALERAEQWRRLAEESDDLAAVSRALRVLARLRWETDDREGHQAAVEAARAVADTMPGCEERAWVANLLAESAMLTGRNTDAVRWADEALATAGTDCSPELRAAVLVNKGSALEMLPGREEEGEALLIEGLAAAEAVQDHLSALRAINNLSHGVFPLWEPERSAALLARTGDLIERSGRQDWAPRWGLLKATYQAHVLGDLEAARREMTATGLSTGRPWTVLTAAELATEAGELDLATSLLDEIDRGTPSDPFVRGMILGHRVRIAAASRNARRIDGLLDQLAAEVNTTVAGTDDRESDESPSDGWHHALVLALHAGVPAARVRAVLAAVGPLPQAPSRATDPGWPPHLDAALAEAEGRFDDALSGYTQAADPPGWRRSPPAAADADMGAARSLDALGRSDEARVFAAAALSRLQRWPGWRRDEAEGLTRRPAPQSELTNREFEVASLVAEGLTNGEIAARLYISTKTASVHVSNILRKLDMTSRAEVAAWVVRQREPTRD